MHLQFFRFSPVPFAVAALLGAFCTGLQAQNFPITAAQQNTADQTARSGVALSDLAPQAPDSYTVKSGDTLWGISGMFLKSAWRWPELWGMNREDIRNPHRIYPGQQLFLEKSNGRATLSTRRGAGGSGSSSQSGNTLRISPRTRTSTLADEALPTLSPQSIEPFLAEPLIVDALEFATAPRIVATQEGRVLLSRGDRAYASGNYADGSTGKTLSDEKGKPFNFRVFRNAKPLKDPTTQEILGYEAQYVGQAELVRGESSTEVQEKDGERHSEKVPATIDIVGSKEEMRIGDRLMPEPPRELRNYVPRAPTGPLSGQIVSVYGSAVAIVGSSQIVVVNRGRRDGLERGHVMAILQDGERMLDKTDSARTPIKLPNERNGLLMVFRTFENLSYALTLQVTRGVKVGDRFTNPN
jgi:LysM repeat protein